MKKLLKVFIVACFALVCNSFVSASSELMAPKIIQSSKDQIVLAGKNALITVKVIGNPAPNCVITFKGKVIRNSSVFNKKYEINEVNGTYNLGIFDVKLSDEGPYTFIFTNPLGSVSTSVVLRVVDALPNE